MYICILQKFLSIGVEMLPRVEPIEEDLNALKALTGASMLCLTLMPWLLLADLQQQGSRCA